VGDDCVIHSKSHGRDDKKSIQRVAVRRAKGTGIQDPYQPFILQLIDSPEWGRDGEELLRRAAAGQIVKHWDKAIDPD
jgi:hypothetical protein